MRHGAGGARQNLQVIPLVMCTPHLAHWVAQTLRPANADVLTALAHQRLGGLGAGLSGRSCPASAVPPPRRHWRSDRWEPSAFRGAWRLIRPLPVAIPSVRPIHDFRHPLGRRLLHVDGSIADRGAVGTGLGAGSRPATRAANGHGMEVVGPDRNARGYRRLPHISTLTRPLHASAPDHADVCRTASALIVAAASGMLCDVSVADRAQSRWSGESATTSGRLPSSRPYGAAQQVVQAGVG